MTPKLRIIEFQLMRDIPPGHFLQVKRFQQLPVPFRIVPAAALFLDPFNISCSNWSSDFIITSRH